MGLSRRTAWERISSAEFPLSDVNATRFFPHASLPAYDPLPFGMQIAREAVAAYYERRGRHVAPERIALTASTSEAYAHAFTLLCDPGDEVLVPTPSYPLFSSLADLTSVTLTSYALHYADGWHLDRQIAVSPRTKAIVVVSPNNPTGHYLTHADWAWLNTFAKQHGLAIIVDEVFADYPLDMPSDAHRFVTESEVFCLTLSGLSKVAAMPQMKLGWMVMSGPHDEAKARLEIILDTYLSVATPVQLALPELLREGEQMQARIREHTRANLDRLKRNADVLRCEGGWTALVRGRIDGAQSGAAFGVTLETSVLSLLLAPLAIDRASAAHARGR